MSAISQLQFFKHLGSYPKFDFKKDNHYLKSVQIRRFFLSVFSYIRTKYGDLLCKFRYLVWIQGNTDQKNSVFGHFPRSE